MTRGLLMALLGLGPPFLASAPLDEPDDGVNGDPDSLWGEDEADDEFDEFSGEDEEWEEEEEEE